MSHKRMNKNARRALKEFKYEMSEELGANNFANTKSHKKNNKRVSEAAEEDMGTDFKF